MPDISASASPLSGYVIFLEGNAVRVGGTSAVSPLLSALTARLNCEIGYNLQFWNPKLYSLPTSCFHDIVTGDNGGFDAGPHWDAVTGLGSPIGMEIKYELTPPNPSSGLINGGTVVKISGSNLQNAVAVQFGSTLITKFTVLSNSLISVVSPPSDS